MGYQWENGRLISDEEKAQETEGLSILIAFVLPTVALGYLGYFYFGKYGMLLLGASGAAIGWKLNEFIQSLLGLSVLAVIFYFALPAIWEWWKNFS